METNNGCPANCLQVKALSNRTGDGKLIFDLPLFVFHLPPLVFHYLSHFAAPVWQTANARLPERAYFATISARHKACTSNFRIQIK